jgi:hypothetical protein
VLDRNGLHSVVFINWVTIFFERESGTYFEEREGGRDGLGNREGHIYMLKTDHTFSLKRRTRKLTGWCSGNAVDLYSGDARFDSLPRHRPP